MSDMYETTTETRDNEGCKCSDIRQAIVSHAKVQIVWCSLLWHSTVTSLVSSWILRASVPVVRPFNFM